MNCERDLITFIDRELMQGQGGDLDATTPLLELRIIDSISMTMLVAHISKRYGLAVPPELMNATNFQDVRSIVALLEGLDAKRRGAAGP